MVKNMKEPDLAGIYLQDVKNFIQAAEAQSFSAVAREYDITPSAVSKSISRLENATNLILFTRQQGKIRLTPAGRKVRESLLHFTASFEAAVEEGHRIQEGITCSLSIGIPNLNVMPKLMESVQLFREKHPEINVTAGIYDFNTLKTRLLEGSLDIILTSYFEHTAFLNTTIKWKLTNPMPLCVFVPESNPLSKKEKITIADLRTEHFIVHSPSMVPGYLKLINELCEPYGFTPLIGKYTDNLGSLIMELVFGKGILIGDELLRSDFPDSVRCYPLEGTISGSIAAWDSSREDKMILELLRILIKLI